MDITDFEKTTGLKVVSEFKDMTIVKLPCGCIKCVKIAGAVKRKPKCTKCNPTAKKPEDPEERKRVIDQFDDYWKNSFLGLSLGDPDDFCDLIKRHFYGMSIKQLNDFLEEME